MTDRERLRVYVDTSVIGGCLDLEFQDWSRRLIRDFELRTHEAVISDVVVAEISRAPHGVQRYLGRILDAGAEVLRVSENSLKLLGAYERAKVLPSRFRNDMLHIAIATVAGADVLVSWNFRHIVRLDKIRQFNAINVDQGYTELAIYSPREVVSHERD